MWIMGAIAVLLSHFIKDPVARSFRDPLQDMGGGGDIMLSGISHASHFDFYNPYLIVFRYNIFQVQIYKKIIPKIMNCSLTRG